VCVCVCVCVLVCMCVCHCVRLDKVIVFYETCVTWLVRQRYMCHPSKVPTAIPAERAISRVNSMHSVSALSKATTEFLRRGGGGLGGVSVGVSGASGVDN
jgi:hypothetical protein